LTTTITRILKNKKIGIDGLTFARSSK
jgi:hypothetical protein